MQICVISQFTKGTEQKAKPFAVLINCESKCHQRLLSVAISKSSGSRNSLTTCQLYDSRDM